MQIIKIPNANIVADLSTKKMFNNFFKSKKGFMTFSLNLFDGIIIGITTIVMSITWSKLKPRVFHNDLFFIDLE